MRLTTRDKELLRKIQSCRWLTTSQIRRVFFPDATLDAVRKRLRKLNESQYLHSFQAAPMSEMIHGVGKPPKTIDHLVSVNQIRLAAEQEGVAFFYAYWELGEFGWEYPVIPDAVVKRDGHVYLVEFDDGTESAAQLKEKFRNYGCFDFPYTLLVVADTAERLKSIEKAANAIIDGEVLMQLLAALDSA
jgi:hypothetical protein